VYEPAAGGVSEAYLLDARVNAVSNDRTGNDRAEREETFQRSGWAASARVKVHLYPDGSHAIFHGPDASPVMMRKERSRR
jgi:hypothetical protein